MLAQNRDRFNSFCNIEILSNAISNLKDDASVGIKSRIIDLFRPIVIHSSMTIILSGTIILTSIDFLPIPVKLPVHLLESLPRGSHSIAELCSGASCYGNSVLFDDVLMMKS